MVCRRDEKRGGWKRRRRAHRPSFGSWIGSTLDSLDGQKRKNLLQLDSMSHWMEWDMSH